MSLYEIVFLMLALSAAGCLVFAVTGGLAHLFRRPIARLAEWLIAR